MGEIINLRRLRKAKAREDERREADANRLKFGQSKADRSLAEANTENAERNLDGHLRET